jgi:hypothetical protein
MSSSIFWRGDMLVWALARQGVWRALLTGGGHNEIWLRLSGYSKRAIRFFAAAAMRLVRGPALKVRLTGVSKG